MFLLLLLGLLLMLPDPPAVQPPYHVLVVAAAAIAGVPVHAGYAVAPAVAAAFCLDRDWTSMAGLDAQLVADRWGGRVQSQDCRYARVDSSEALCGPAEVPADAPQVAPMALAARYSAQTAGSVAVSVGSLLAAGLRVGWEALVQADSLAEARCPAAQLDSAAEAEASSPAWRPAQSLPSVVVARPRVRSVLLGKRKEVSPHFA